MTRLRSIAFAGATALIAACSSSPKISLDSGPGIDAPRDGATDGKMIDATAPGAPYRHTVVIDGTNDFTAAEQFPTTSNGFTAGVTWDDTNVYVGYTGSDIAGSGADAANEWVFAYLDVDPGAATGAAMMDQYDKEQATFPTGFGAEYYVRWKTDNTFNDIQQFSSAGKTWAAVSPKVAPNIARNGMYMEMSFPRSLVGASTNKIGILTYMYNQTDGAEGIFAGLYSGNFADGNPGDMVMTKYLKADFTAASDPNDPANLGP